MMLMLYCWRHRVRDAVCCWHRVGVAVLLCCWHRVRDALLDIKCEILCLVLCGLENRRWIVMFHVCVFLILNSILFLFRLGEHPVRTRHIPWGFSHAFADNNW